MATVDTIKSSIDSAAERYDDTAVLRASLHLIPHIGPALDALIAGRGAQIYKARVGHFLQELRERLEDVEKSAALDVESPAFMDVMTIAIEQAARSRSERKRGLLAKVLVHQVQHGSSWDEAEMATRLVAGLEEIHIEILSVALNAPAAGAIFAGMRVVALTYGPSTAPAGAPMTLVSALPQYPIEALRMACAELASKGLLHDEGIGRWDTQAMQYFVPTDLAYWLKSHSSRSLD